MRIQLEQDDIERAIKNYLNGQGIATINMTIDMAFKAGRKGSGLTVEISISKPILPEKFVLPQTEATMKPQKPETVNTLVEPEVETVPTTGSTGSLFG